MSKEFNDVGNCIPERHFMADISAKLDAILPLIEEGKYFTINRPRQYGKTTIQDMLWRRLRESSEYAAINISFEKIDHDCFKSTAAFTDAFLLQLADYAEETEDHDLEAALEKHKGIGDFSRLSRFITDLTRDKKIVLMIDEVDTSSNNQLFLDFLALLRDKYLKRNQGRGATFQSVILAGVHDVKNLRLKIRPGDELRYNSPWNIAVDFDVDLSLHPEEIASMLQDYSAERGVSMDISAIAERLFFHTSGYPFLTSRLCKIMDEKMDLGSKWRLEHVDQAAALILKDRNTNFESLIKNLENNEALYRLTQAILLDGVELTVDEDIPGVADGIMYGVFRSNGRIIIHNRVYEQRIYNYMTGKLRVGELIDGTFNNYTHRDNYLNADGRLNLERVLLKFQEFMGKEYSNRDEKFYEREGRLIFLAFLRPIINGHGFDFKEPQISEEKRLDIVVVYRDEKYVIELKIWRGPKLHEKGLAQLGDYLDRQGLSRGYLASFDFNKKDSRKGESEWIRDQGKEIFAVWV